MLQHRPAVGALLLVSGLCALVYQTVWMRELRLVFGASTLAGAAVLAIFMGGLGAGAAFLGRRADTHPHPLAFYGKLEVGIALSAALTPLLIDLARSLYIKAGGSVALGATGATAMRLLLAAVVLAVPTVLMGGTLPAAARSIASDEQRRGVALLYAMNTAGAVTGVLLAGFVLLERLGNRKTLWIAAAVNLAIGAICVLARRKESPQSVEEHRAAPSRMPRSRTAICVAAAVTGFVFLLMELVWYRMLSPLLGGTTFMFALVLAVALAGIGAGGAIYTRLRSLATPSMLAIALALEAFALAAPYAIGDRIALLANAVRDQYMFGWALVTVIVVLPAAIVAGVQFPLLIALLGRGADGVGRDVGAAYAWNTGGAIAGSLFGGFALIPLLGATGCWRLSVALLSVVAVYFAVRARRVLVPAMVAGVAVLASFAAPGPSAVWRHSGIGAGRAPTESDEAWTRTIRRTLLVEAEGVESSIALMTDDDLGLIVNGKSDGSARRDAGTQVMAGMIAALLHPAPHSAMVVGLGTGTTAGWLASIPSVTNVDVVELEPAVVRVAAQYAAVNHNALQNPKVRLASGDAREVLLVSRDQYDIIFSEPSNPYRAGVASLYTREFYKAVRQRLATGGIFAQWVQTYSIDAPTMHTIYATLHSVFPHVETWTTNPGDVVLLASQQPMLIDARAMRARLLEEPHRSAAHYAWRVESLEGVLSHFIASDQLTRDYAKQAVALNTDDRPVIEFGFARSLGHDSFGTADLVVAAADLDADRPNVAGRVDWAAVAANRAALAYLSSPDPRNSFARAYAAAEFGNAARAWSEAPWEPVNSRQLASIAHALAIVGDERAAGAASELRTLQPAEADAVTGILRQRQGNPGEAAEPIARALLAYRHDAWPQRPLMESALAAAAGIATDPAHAPRMLDALSQPYAAYQLEEVRRLAYVAASWHNSRCSTRTVSALAALEPHAPWVREVLQMRALCYESARLGELAAVAKEDLARFDSRVTSSSVQSARASPRP